MSQYRIIQSQDELEPLSPLSSSGDDDEEKNVSLLNTPSQIQDSKPHNSQKQRNRHRNKYWILLLLLLLLTTLNLSLTFLRWHRSSSSSSSSSNSSKSNSIPFPTNNDRPLSTLHFPNQFRGLNSTFRLTNGASHLSHLRLVSFPLLLQPIDRSRAEYVYPDDPRRHLVRFGSVAPEDRHLVVSDQVSTIAQFHPRDYGMENCKLVLSLPLSRMHNSTSSQSQRERDYLPFQTLHLEIWSLDTAGLLINPRTLSYSTRPRRMRRVDVLDIKPGETSSSEEFVCPVNSLLAFEIACSVEGGSGSGDGGCMLDVWQDKFLPPVGLVIEQRKSIV